MLPSSRHRAGHSLGSLQCVWVSVLPGKPHLDVVASRGQSRWEWNSDLKLLAALLLTQPRDERCSVRAEAEELCRASAAPHQHLPSPRCPQVRLGCLLSSGAECSAVCSPAPSCSHRTWLSHSPPQCPTVAGPCDTHWAPGARRGCRLTGGGIWRCCAPCAWMRP